VPDALLRVENARRSFETPEGGQITALDGIDLEVAPREFVTLLGPSGCGKTTLLRAIAGFEVLESGRIVLDGVDITDAPAHRRPVNTVFQSYALFPHMSVARNVGYALEVAGMANEERRSRVVEALALVGLSDYGTRRPSQLSGGQRQRVALARALVARPKLLLLDEPLSALDRRLRQQMQIELKTLQSDLGVAFVFVTHDQEEALTMSDRIMVMKAGRVEQVGTPREIYRAPLTRFVAEFIGETNLFKGRVESVANGVAWLRTPEGLLVAASVRSGQKLGDAAVAALRPTDVSVLRNGDVCDGRISLAGTVTKEVFLGADLHLFVELEGGGLPLHVVARDVDASGEVGRRVMLAYDPARAHVLEDEP
jgi:spermidine/putrescine transport system ATP-binding protein